MIQFSKSSDNFICKECNRICIDFKGFCIHIAKMHNSRLYYDKWIKEKDDGLCKICSSETKFMSLNKGYRNTCCKEHELKYTDIRAKETLNKKYGGDSPFCKKETHNKSKQTLIKKYGVNHNFKIEGMAEQKIKTWNKNLGVDNPSQSIKIKEKKEQTCLKHYGVKHQMQNKEIFEKSQKHSYYTKEYKNTNVYYRGSYELDFLEKYFAEYLDIQNAKAIKYIINNELKIYHPDFYIPSLNLIIECKNSYLLKKDKNIIKAKEKATIANGFKYCLIVDKKYDNFIS